MYRIELTPKAEEELRALKNSYNFAADYEHTETHTEGNGKLV